LGYDAETERFRAEFLAWVDEHLPTLEERGEAVLSSAHLPAWARAWQRCLFDAGWLVPGWPPEYGGRNATPVQQLVYFEELARHEIPRGFNPQGLSIITPSILDWGTEEQQQTFALGTLRAEITWCLGMSEPGAGSDLAGLRTRAELDGDHFVVNGQKVWTSGAHHADYCFCFVRTDPSAPKHAGISVLIIDMRTPGITVRSLPELTDPHHADFNEVFFTDVVVPREHLVGELHGGWSVAGGSLAHERGMLWIGQATGLERVLDAALEVARRRRRDGEQLANDPVLADELARLYVDVQAVRLMGYRGFAKLARGRSAPEHSMLKLFASETEQRAALVIAEALGADAVDLDQVVTAPGHQGLEPWVVRYLRSFSGTIAGGTSEIQRSIIAERVLGLPRLPVR
jgi:alkylation response protein AidB-like acyl-CoA dehydrogenase